MKKFVLSNKVKSHSLLSFPLCVLLYFLVPYWWWKASSILLILLSVLGAIDVFVSCFIVEEDKLIVANLFKRKQVYWKDIRVVKLYCKNNKIGKEIICHNLIKYDVSAKNTEVIAELVNFVSSYDLKIVNGYVYYSNEENDILQSVKLAK